jgi:hypothetical protein
MDIRHGQRRFHERPEQRQPPVTDFDGTSKPVVIPPNEAARILELARRWAPYGGPPDDDIFVQFGLTRAEFMNRLDNLMRGPMPRT